MWRSAERIKLNTPNSKNIRLDFFRLLDIWTMKIMEKILSVECRQILLFVK